MYNIFTSMTVIIFLYAIKEKEIVVCMNIKLRGNDTIIITTILLFIFE